MLRQAAKRSNKFTQYDVGRKCLNRSSGALVSLISVMCHSTAFIFDSY